MHVISWFVLLVIALVGLIAIGLLVGLVLLLVYPKTRVAGVVLMLVLLAVPAMIVFALAPTPAVEQVHRGYNNRSHHQPATLTETVEAKQHINMAERVLLDPTNDAQSTPTVAETAENKPLAAEAKRPDWIGTEPQRVGDAYQRTLVVGPYTTRLECDAHLPKALEEALEEYADVCFGREAAKRVKLPRRELPGLLVREQWEETRKYTTVGPMKNLHVLLHFDRKLKDRIAQQWKDTMIADRLWIVGGTLGSVLVLMTVLFGFLKIHTRRRQDQRNIDGQPF